MGPAPPVAVVTRGQGPELLLVHGGASPSTTWGPLSPFASRWTLALMHRRGYPPSPPPQARRQDFDVDATDIAGLLGSRPHVVAHSYGALGAVLAATRQPERVSSLTLIEPAFLGIVDGDPDVARLRHMAEIVLRDGLDADASVLRRFLRVAGVHDLGAGTLPEPVARGVGRAHGGRSPVEARPDLRTIRDARVPTLVVSGDHDAGIERICDAAASELGAERLVLPGAGHFVAAAPGFLEELERFLTAGPRSGRSVTPAR